MPLSAMPTPRLLVLTGFILGAAALRIAPHLPNFSPIAAMALFGGAHFSDKRLAFAVPLAALLLSDCVLGFYAGMATVYASFAIVVVLGLWLRSRRTPALIAGTALLGSFLFFLITNFGYWTSGVLYPRTLSGLAACYAAAIPFFRNTLAGDLFYTAVLFGGFALAQRRFPLLRDPAASQA
jgi:hypothetical protein